VPAGRTTRLLAENIDLAPTFARIGRAGVPGNVDGHSLLALLGGHRLRGWRSAALVEHHGPDFLRGDPDRPIPGSGNPTSYEAIRTPASVYVEYASGEREYYDLRRDPNELRNSASGLSRRAGAALHRTLAALESCHSGGSCWAAAHGR
jgi:arylsulfatase A-like enzyme